jgi:transposase
MIIKHIIGIDVSKDTLAVAFGTLMADQTQIITSSIILDNNLKGFKKALAFAKKNIGKSTAPYYFVMEATGVYYENLAYFLSDHKQQVVVVLPNKAKNFSKTLEIKTKTDKIDAKKLTQFGLEKKLYPWQVPSPTMKALKALTREHHSIKEMIVQIKNQIHAKNYAHEPLKETLKRSKEALAVFEKQIKVIEKQIKEIVNQDPELKAKVQKIIKVEGIGLISIVSIIAETDGFALIRNGKQLTSYAGIDVVYNESGLKKHKTTISKKGNKHLRRAVYMPALSASRHNPKLKQLYIRLVTKKNIKKLALIAVARKLLLLVYTIYTKNVDYISNYNPAYAGKHSLSLV